LNENLFSIAIIGFLSKSKRRPIPFQRNDYWSPAFLKNICKETIRNWIIENQILEIKNIFLLVDFSKENFL